MLDTDPRYIIDKLIDINERSQEAIIKLKSKLDVMENCYTEIRADLNTIRNTMFSIDAKVDDLCFDEATKSLQSMHTELSDLKRDTQRIANAHETFKRILIALSTLVALISIAIATLKLLIL